MGWIDIQTDGRTDGRQTVTLRFQLELASIITSDLSNVASRLAKLDKHETVDRIIMLRPKNPYSSCLFIYHHKLVKFILKMQN